MYVILRAALSADGKTEAIHFCGGFCKRLDQIKPHTDYIYLHVKGEPLLHPKIDQLLDLSHEKGLKLILQRTER